MDLGDQIALVALGAALTFFGGAGGAWWSSRLEHRRWLRQERLKAWAALQAAARSADAPMVEIRRSDPGTDRWDAASDGLGAVTAELSRAWSVVQLLGPKMMLVAADKYYLAVLHAVDDMTSEENHERFRRERNMAEREFVTAARSWLRSE